MSISEILKQKTRNLHDLTEEKFQSRKIFSGDFTPEDYRRLLLYNFYLINTMEQPVFGIISKEIASKLGLKKRIKLKSIQKDMAALELDEKFVNDAPLPKNEAEAMGMLYVMEGSTLGGNVIAKNLAKSEGFKNITFNYFGFYGDETGSMWKNFKKVMDEDFAEKDLNDLISGAEKAYRFLLRC